MSSYIITELSVAIFYIYDTHTLQTWLGNKRGGGGGGERQRRTEGTQGPLGCGSAGEVRLAKPT